MHYKLASPLTFELEVKRSQFIALCSDATTREEAILALEQARQDYPDARHHCWAYLLGAPNKPLSMAASDDGEPSGTAGKPILNVLQHNDVGDIMVIVVRYFGGIKLGAGGLVRAYSSVTQQILERIEKTPFVEMSKVSVTCNFAQEQYLRHIVEQASGVVLKADYTSHVGLHIDLPKDQISHLTSQCKTNQWLIRNLA